MRIISHFSFLTSHLSKEDEMRNTVRGFLLLFIVLSSAVSYGDDLPVIVPELALVPYSVFQNAVTSGQLNNIVGGTEEGLILDLNDPKLSGQVYMSQYPFEGKETVYDYAYYMDEAVKLSEGKAVLPLADFYKSKYNANAWVKGEDSGATPTVEYRLRLFKPGKLLGLYASRVSFGYDGHTFRKLPTMIGGPYVTKVSSDDPTTLEIVWETDELCSGKVNFGAKSYDESSVSLSHRVKISGLTPDSVYDYYVESASSDGRIVRSETYSTRTAPAKGQGTFTFAYASDSYDDVGGGGKTYMGINRDILDQISAHALRSEAEFILFGGDLVMGYSGDKENLDFQLQAWKQVVSGYWRNRPIYPTIGNHEFVWNYYEGDETVLAKWPYSTDSGEAVFAEAFNNPENAPVVSDSRRPTYQESVYSFQYGPAMVICFNNAYWTTGFSESAAEMYGGCPLGYIMEDQLQWIENSLSKAESDTTVRYIFLFGHTPVFPYTKHVADGMWYMGNNNIRAYTKNAETGKLEAASQGIIEVRNRFWKAIAQSAKVAAVFTSHEHGYHRTLISNTTPVGVFPDDDTDGDGVLDKYSPNPDFVRPVWHIMSAGAGSGPYDTKGYPTPWTPEKASSQYGYVLVHVENNKVSMELIGGVAGEVLDRVDDLMSVK